MRLDIEESKKALYSRGDTSSSKASASKNVRSFFEKIRQEILIKPGPIKTTLTSKLFWSTLLYAIYSTGFCIIDLYAEVWTSTFTNSTYFYCCSLHVINAHMFVWSRNKNYSYCHMNVYPEYLNILGSILYLYSASLYKDDEYIDMDPTFTIDIDGGINKSRKFGQYTSEYFTIRYLEVAASAIEMVAAICWVQVWHQLFKEEFGTRAANEFCGIYNTTHNSKSSISNNNYDNKNNINNDGKEVKTNVNCSDIPIKNKNSEDQFDVETGDNCSITLPQAITTTVTTSVSPTKMERRTSINKDSNSHQNNNSNSINSSSNSNSNNNDGEVSLLTPSLNSNDINSSSSNDDNSKQRISRATFLDDLLKIPIGKGWTLQDPDLWANASILVAAFIYLIYNLEVLIISTQGDYNDSMLYYYGDYFYFLNSLFCLLASLRDCGVFRHVSEWKFLFIFQPIGSTWTAAERRRSYLARNRNEITSNHHDDQVYWVENDEDTGLLEGARVPRSIELHDISLDSGDKSRPSSRGGRTPIPVPDSDIDRLTFSPEPISPQKWIG